MTEDEFDNMKNAAVSDAGDAYDKALEDGAPKPEAASTAIEFAALCGFDFCSWHVFNQHDGVPYQSRVRIPVWDSLEMQKQKNN